MILSIIIPVYNEEKTLQAVLERINEVVLKDIKKEIIIVNDGSTDKSLSIISNFKFSHSVEASRDKQLSNLQIISHKQNKGKGAAVISGLKLAKGEYAVIQDADLEYNPNDLEKLLAPILSGESEVVYGTRLRRMPNFNRDERTMRFFIHYLGNKCLSLLTSLLYGQWITDMETCYKVFPTRILKDTVLRARGFEFEPEITAKLFKKGYRITEVPITTNPRGYKEGKKLHTIRDGIRAVLALVKYRFVD